MTTTLWVGRALADLGGANPTHQAIHVTGDTITWAGDPADAPPADQVNDLGEVWLTPGFVDAHVHGTATGLQATGVDLTGATSLREALDRVRRHATGGRVVHGTGWDDSGWPERRPPTADELTDAAGGKPVILTRVDGHSCVVDRGTVATLDLSGHEPHVVHDSDGRPSGWLKEGASAVANRALWTLLGPDDLSRARHAAVQRAIRLGITAIHEMGIPALSTIDDALAWADGDWPIEVHAYWGDLDVDPAGPLRPGGDLFLDGSIGSCTAATSSPYLDNVGQPVTAEVFHSDAEVRAFFVRATRAGVGAGVHAIGDAAIAQAVRAIRDAATTCGTAAVRAARHRIEHCELIGPDDIAAMADLGVVASVQPAFDATWNGPGGLYEHRFGREAANVTNPLKALADAGVSMCFSSDSTVTPMDPWGGVLAAERHHGGHGLDRRTALVAATLGGHHVVGAEGRVGPLLPGRRADFVAWPGDPLTRPDPAKWTPLAVVSRGRHLPLDVKDS